jgi:flavin-dependent dehydrogenase
VSPPTVEVAVVGGGLAGSVVAALLAREGREVVVLERAPGYRWHAGGVFTSPASMSALRSIGLPGDVLASVARPTPAMRVETRRGVRVRLTYGDDGSLASAAVGLDRERLDPALLALAAGAGADVRTGVTVERVTVAGQASEPLLVEARHAGPADEPAGEPAGERAVTLRARVVVGADGIRSVVARSLGVRRAPPFAGRVGLTFHLADPSGPGPRDARMIVLHDGYVGIAPVPDGRVNVGIVLGSSWRGRLATDGAEAVARGIVGGIAATPDDPAGWRDGARGWHDGARRDAVAGAAPIGNRVAQRAGPGWFLVGDAAGFVDPFTGEGIHRALVSAELAAEAVAATLDGSASTAAAAYERAMRARFRSKDRVSTLVQAFLGRPALFEYAARRLATRGALRDTLGLVMGDLVPAERALDPRFLAALLAP